MLLICINYHNEPDTCAFVHNVLELDAGGSLEVLVVNNNEGGGGEEPLVELENGEPRVKLLSSGENLGYFGGASLGLRRHLESGDRPEWVLVSNTDISFPDRRFFVRLQELYKGGAPAVVAPTVRSALSSRDQNPYMARRPPARRMHFYKWVFSNYLTYSAYYSVALAKKGVSRLLPRSHEPPAYGHEPRVEEKGPGEIYAPHGSFLVFHRSYFDAGGDLDYGAFLYGEEVFVAETARRLNLSVVYDPRLAVLHREHETTGLFKSRKIARLQRDSSAYCADEFFGRREW